MQTLNTTHQAPSSATRPNALSRLFNPGPDFLMMTPQHEQRHDIEDYIAAKFFKDHDAHIKSFMPYLLTMSCAGHFSSTVGIRPAKDNRLFVETYLDKPVEDYVADITGNTVPRDAIVEIGNLVATQGGASQLVFIMLTATLFQANVQWVAFTATAQVEHLLKKLDFTCHGLCAADPSRLGDDAAQWGNYYATSPHVMLINVAEAMQKTRLNRLANSAIGMYSEKIPALANMLTLQAQTPNGYMVA